MTTPGSIKVQDPFDLELSLTRGDERSDVRARVTYRRPNGEAEIAGVAQKAPIKLDMAALNALWLDPVAYGKALTDRVFQDPDLRADLRLVRDQAAAVGSAVRLRLRLDASVADLQAVRWETLRDPADDLPLGTSERIWLSRFLSTHQAVELPALGAGRLKTVVLIASPSDQEQLQLVPVDVDAELGRLRGALTPKIAALTVLARPTVAADPPVDGPPTLDALMEHLRDGVDLVVIVAHGRMVRDKPLLYLEQDGGLADKVAGADLVERIGALLTPPRLMVLISCQSGAPARNRSGVLSALGPSLADVGVPAVVAMQGDISVATADSFAGSFFSDVVGHGQIDRAVSVARGKVRDQPDAWMPALFMRLDRGMLWAAPADGGDRPAFDKWPVVVQRIRDGTCTPVLGPGLLESLLGSTRDIAAAWAAKHHFPLAEQASRDLPQVAQYLAVSQNDPEYPRSQLRDFLKESLVSKYGRKLQDAGAADPAGMELGELVSAVGRIRRASQDDDPHRVLAGLPFKLFITTNPDDFMEEAIREAGTDAAPRTPHPEVCRWNDGIDWTSEWDGPSNRYRPSVAEPLVMHLFGTFDTPRSIVLTEDDHFDYLIGMGRGAASMPSPVMRAIKDDALLFLGFRLDTWNFRVLLRSFVNLALGGRRPRPHIAVQVDPADTSLVDPDGARRYLEAYFGQEDISLYWGSVDDLLGELRVQLG